MANDLTPILIKDLTGAETISDSDYIIIGGADAKKVTVAQLKEALGINALNTKIENGLSLKGAFTGNLNSTSIAAGIYIINANNTVSNMPDTSAAYCTFIQLWAFKMQVIIDTYGIYVRKYAGSPAAWSGWVNYKHV